LRRLAAAACRISKKLLRREELLRLARAIFLVGLHE